MRRPRLRVPASRGVGTSDAAPALIVPDRPRQPDAAEDLPPIRVIPVAEAGPQGRRLHRPRPAAQHPVVPAEERLGVALVNHRGEARPRLQRRARPLPDVAEQLLDSVGRRAGRVGADRRRAQSFAAEVGVGGRRLVGSPRIATPRVALRIPRARLLPFGFGGQPGTGPRGVGLSLEIADVLDRFVGGDVLDATEPATRPSVGIPELRRGQARILAMLPAPCRPPPRLRDSRRRRRTGAIHRW